MGAIQTVLALLRTLLVARAALAAENLALRNRLPWGCRSLGRVGDRRQPLFCPKPWFGGAAETPPDADKGVAR